MSYAVKHQRNDFSFLLKAAVGLQVSSRMSAGRAFHVDGPENENALSPNFIIRKIFVAVA